MTQPTNFTFNFEKTHKDIDVAGKIYTVEFNDDAQLRYQKAIKVFQKDSTALQKHADKIDLIEGSDEEIDKMNEMQKNTVKKLIETYLGEGAFDELYEKSGRSVINLMSLVYYLIDLYRSEETEKIKNTRDKYLNNVKKNV